MKIEELKSADDILDNLSRLVTQNITEHYERRPDQDTSAEYDDNWIEANDLLHRRFDKINEQRMKIVEEFCSECYV